MDVIGPPYSATYRVRWTYTLESGIETLALGPTISVRPPTLTIDGAGFGETVARRGNHPVTVDVASSPDGNARIAWMRVPNLPEQQSFPLNGTVNGSVSGTAPDATAGGSFQLQLISPDGTVHVKGPNVDVPPQKLGLKADAMTEVAFMDVETSVGGTVRVTVNGTGRQPGDHIALYKVGTADGSTTYADCPVSGNPDAVIDGVDTLYCTVTPTETGVFEFRHFAGDSGIRMATSKRIVVKPPPPRLTINGQATGTVAVRVQHDLDFEIQNVEPDAEHFVELIATDAIESLAIPSSNVLRWRPGSDKLYGSKWIARKNGASSLVTTGPALRTYAPVVAVNGVESTKVYGGTLLKVTVTNPHGLPSDTVGLYRLTDPESAAPFGGRISQLNGTPRFGPKGPDYPIYDVLDWLAPGEPGIYEVRVIAGDNGASMATARVSVVEPLFTIDGEKGPGPWMTWRGIPVTVIVAHPGGTPEDTLGLYPNGSATPVSPPYTLATPTYVKPLTVGGEPLPFFEVPFETAALPQQGYDFKILLGGDGPPLLTERLNVHETHITAAGVNAGGSVTIPRNSRFKVLLSDPPNRWLDFIGVYRVGAPVEQRQDWVYLGTGKQVIPIHGFLGLPAPPRLDAFTLTMPLGNEPYEVRLYSQKCFNCAKHLVAKGPLMHAMDNIRRVTINYRLDDDTTIPEMPPHAPVILHASGNPLYPGDEIGFLNSSEERVVIPQGGGGVSLDGFTPTARGQYRVALWSRDGGDSTYPLQLVDTGPSFKVVTGDDDDDDDDEERGPDTVTYLETDAIGSVRVETDASGNTKAAHVYQPFGRELATNNSNSDDRVRFAGKEFEKDSGLTYFGARDYLDLAGLMLRPDPVPISEARLFDPQQIGRYAYARNNPHRYADPDGRELVVNAGWPTVREHLCTWLGDEDCQRITIDERTGRVSVDFSGIDLPRNMGAALLFLLIRSDEVYSVTYGTTMGSYGGMTELKGFEWLFNNDNGPYPGPNPRPARERPPAGVANALGINFGAVESRSLSGKLSPALDSMVLFHELAEAWWKVAAGMPRGEPGQGGAHDLATRWEQILRSQRMILNNWNLGSGVDNAHVPR